MADSRPEPGPLTRTSISLMPCDMAWRAASCATCWAAKAVLLREPLKPTRPALDQPSTLPCMSVMVTLVLLNVARMLAMPTAMFFAPLALMIFLALASSRQQFRGGGRGRHGPAGAPGAAGGGGAGGARLRERRASGRCRPRASAAGAAFASGRSWAASCGALGAWRLRVCLLFWARAFFWFGFLQP